MPTPKTKKLPAGVTKLASGQFNARIRLKGLDRSSTHATLSDAKLWIEREKYAVRQLAAQGLSAKITLSAAVQKYIDEVCPLHRGAKWEIVRFKQMLRYLPDKLLTDYTPADIAVYRDTRLKEVGEASVRREMGLISAFFEQCRKEWQFVTVNPCTDIKRPRSPKHRERLVTDDEVKLMCEALGYTGKVTTQNHQVAITMLIALETGMRSGEIVGLTWDRVHLDRQYLRLDATKNGTVRDVPLSNAAVNLLKKMRGISEPQVFNLHNSSRDALFRAARRRAGIDGFTFHDLRHTAATRLAQKLHALELCKVMGWLNPKQALVYYNPTATDIAARLD